MWTVPRDSSLPHDDLENVKLLFMDTFLCYCINTYSKLLPNKYIELNETKAVAGVPMPGPTSLYKYFINAHPLIGNISKGKIIKYEFNMFLINFNLPYKTPL